MDYSKMKKAQLIEEIEALQEKIEGLERAQAEREPAEEELKELLGKIERAKQEWESTADSLPDLICLVDHQGRIIRANRTVETWKLARVVDVKGRGVHELIHPGCTGSSCYLDSFWKGAWEEAIQGQRAQCEAYDEVLRRHVLVRVQPWKDWGKGTALGSTVVVVQDITERKRAEEALRESEASYRELADSIADVFFAFDKDLRHTYWNKASEELTGIPANDAIGKSLYELFPDVPQTRKAERVYLDVLTTRQPQTFVNEYPLGGEDFLFEISVYPSRGGISVFTKDITERKRAEEALRESEERYRAIFEQAADSIVLVDAETGALVEFNERAHENLRYTRDEFETLKIPDFEVIESAEEVTKHIEQIVREGADAFETRHRTKDGEIRDILVSSRALHIGGRDFVQSIWSDITERKRAEEALRRERDLAEALEEAAAAVSSTLDLDEVLDHILEQAERVVAGDAFSVILIEDDGGRVARWRGYELPEEEMQPLRFDIPITRYSKVMKMARTGKPVVVPDTSVDPDWVPAARDQGWRRSYVGVPIQLGDVTVGFLSVSGTRPGQFGPEDARRMEAFASHAAIAIENARLYQATQQELTERKRAEEALRWERDLAEALEEATAALTATLDFEQVLDRILEQVSRVVPSDATNIMLIEGDQAHIVRWRGYKRFGAEEFISTLVFHIPGTASLQQMVEGREPMVIPDTATYPGWVHVPVQDWLRSYAAAPIIVRGEVIGFLNVDSATPGFFTQAHTGALRAFAEHAAAAIENARLYDGIQEKVDELELLLDTATTVSSTLELDRILPILAEKMATSVEATFCRIALLDGINKTLTIRAASPIRSLDWNPDLGRQYALADAPWHRQVIERGETIVLRQDDASKAASETECRIALSQGIQSALLIPLVVGNRTLGVVSLGEMRSWQRVPFTADRVGLCQAMANATAVAIEKAQLLDAVTKHRRDLQRLSAQLINAQEEERKRISRELHDEMGQALTAIGINLAAIGKELPSELTLMTRERLAEASWLADQLLKQVRELSLDLRPTMLDDLGVVSALRWYVNRYVERLNIEVKFEALDFEERLTPEMETALYRAVQEALTNVARHAHANTIRLHLKRKESTVVAFIEDDGQGFDVEKLEGREAPERGVGLLGIRERVASLGGSLSIQSRPGQGTRLTIEMPV